MIFSQRSFAAGEISPSLYARVDFQKYATALRTLKNMYVMRHGGATNRAGTEFIGEARDSAENVRLIPFVYGSDQTYVLEFSDYYMRVIKNGAYVTLTAQDITAISNANPCVVTYSGDDNYTAGDQVQLSGIVGAIGNYLNGRTFLVGTVVTAGAGGTFELKYNDGTNVNSTSWGAYTSNGEIEEVYQVATPWAHADLADLKYDQKEGTLTVVHPDYPPYEITRTSDSSWSIKQLKTRPLGTGIADVDTALIYQDYPNYCTTTKTTNIGFETYRYKITLVNGKGEESLPGTYWTSFLISNIKKKGSEIFLKIAAPSSVEGIMLSGDQVYIDSVEGMTELNENYYTVDRNYYAITGITRGNPTVISITDPADADYDIQTGDSLYISNFSIIGVDSQLRTNVANKLWTITRLSDTTFSIALDSTLYASDWTNTVPGFVTDPTKISLLNVDPTTYTAYSMNGYVRLISMGAFTCATPLTTTDYITIGISSAPVSQGEGVTAFKIYKYYYGVYGLLATIGVESNVASNGFIYFYDDGTLSPDVSQSPPIPSQKFFESTEYPSTVAHVQQRQAFAGSSAAPSTVDLSRIGSSRNFSAGFPIADDDRVQFSLSGGRRGQQVQDILDVGGKLVILTKDGAWYLPGNSEGVITPSSIAPKLQSSYGSNGTSPVIVGESALYISSRGSSVRDLAFDYQVDGYRGNELTLLASHLIEGNNIIEWAYQQHPHSIVWCVMEDGSVISLTYVKEQQVYAWARHDFGGLVKNVCSVPGSTEDEIYFVIERTIGASTKQYIEKLSTRVISDIVYAAFMDSWIEYDGNFVAQGNLTMTLSGGTNWTYDEELTLTFNGFGLIDYFTSDMVGNAIHLTGSDGTVIRFTITGYTSATVVTGNAHATVPVSIRNTAFYTWGHAVDELTGLWHLEGEDVTVFADGNVLANPNGDGYQTYTVTNGAITLDRPYVVVKVGLPYISDIETLDVDTAQGEPIMDKNKLVTAVALHMESTRGGFVGAKPPEDDTVDPLEGLTEIKYRDAEELGETTNLFTGVKEINIEPEWNSNGRVFIRQVDPLPMSVLAVSPAGLFPIRGG